MTRRCDRCYRPKGVIGTLTTVTITDSSGGSGARLCGYCIDKAFTDRCCLCGTEKHGGERAEYLAVKGEPAAVPICDDCRAHILFGKVAA